MELHANCRSLCSLPWVYFRDHNRDQRLQPQCEAGLSLAKYLEHPFGQHPSASADLCDVS